MNTGVLKLGEFTLKSGRKSPYFFNTGFFRAASRGDECDARTPCLVGYANHNNLADSVVGADDIFYLPGENVETTGHDHVLGAVDDVQETIGIEVPGEARELKPRIGYMTQKFSLFGDMTVAENMQFISELYSYPKAGRKGRIEELLEKYDLTEQRRQMAGTMSGGQKQRLALACPCSTGPNCCCSTNRPAPSTRRAAGISGRTSSGSPSVARPFSCPRITWTRPSAAIGSRFSTAASRSRTALPVTCSPVPACRSLKSRLRIPTRHKPRCTTCPRSRA